MSQFTQEHINWVNGQVSAGAYADAKSAVDALCAHSNIVADAAIYAQFGISSAPVAVETPAATVPSEAPSTLEVAQQALPVGFDIMGSLKGRLPSEKSSSRPKNYEVSIEELRSRVTFRDGQPVGKKDETIVWLRPYLAPNTVAVEEVNGVMADGAPKNHWVVPAQFEEAAKEQLMQLFLQGTYDKQLLDVAEQQKQKDIEKAEQPTKAPVDSKAADAALGELAAATPVAAQPSIPTQAAPAASVPTMPTGMPTGLPAGMPAGLGVPGL